GDFRVHAAATAVRRAVEPGGPYAHLVQREEHARVVRLSGGQRRGSARPTRAIAARPHVLLREGLRRQPDRDHGPGPHVSRPEVAGTTRRMAVQTRTIQGLLPL